MRQAKALLLLRIVLMLEMGCVLGSVATRGKGVNVAGTDLSSILRLAAYAGFVVWLLGMIVLQVLAARSCKKPAAKPQSLDE